MVLPEELAGAGDAVLAARKRMVEDDLLNASDKLRWFGLLLGGISTYVIYQGWKLSPGAETSEKLIFTARAIVGSMSMGIVLLMFLIFAFIPWYQARKRRRELAGWKAGDIATLVPMLRFETWLHAQKAPFTRVLFALVCLTGLTQLLPSDSIQAAGFVKSAYRDGQWWRILTAPLLHGNLIHFLMNGAALLYLGKRLEVFARWPHLALVFLFSACVGGEASARFTDATSVGSSGGLMGLLGFLLVFESLHARLVPRTARRRLVAGVLLTGLIGLVGYRFIDNAAHVGGLLAGMIYAAIVFPKSSSPIRPNSNNADRIAGATALAVILIATIIAIFKITMR